VIPKKYNNIEEAYFNALKNILKFGEEVPIDHGSYEKELYRLQLPIICGTIKDPLDFSFLSNPNFPQVISEHAINEYFDNYIICADEKEPHEEYTYSERIVKDFSQLSHCIEKLMTGYTNQAAISISKPSDILLKDPPCLRNITFSVRLEFLDMTFVFRSWDIFAAMPLNISGLSLLLDYVVGFTNKKLGELHFVGSNAHIYSSCIDFAKNYIYR